MRLIDANRLVVIINNILEATTSNSKLDVFKREICKLFLEIINEQPTIPAISIGWLRNLCTIAEMETDDKMFIDWLIQTWREEQEVQDG